MSSALTRAVLLVFDATCTDTEAALVRNGLRMFRGVERVIPVRGVLSDMESRTLLARDALGVENEQLRQQVRDLSLRLRSAQEAVTGPVPEIRDVPITAEFDRDADLRRA